MTKTLEEILGFDPLTYVNEIPGKIKCDFREFWYVEDNEGIFQKKLFSKLVDAVNLNKILFLLKLLFPFLSIITHSKFRHNYIVKIYFLRS